MGYEILKPRSLSLFIFKIGFVSEKEKGKEDNLYGNKESEHKLDQRSKIIYYPHR